MQPFSCFEDGHAGVVDFFGNGFGLWAAGATVFVELMAAQGAQCLVDEEHFAHGEDDEDFCVFGGFDGGFGRYFGLGWHVYVPLLNGPAAPQVHDQRGGFSVTLTLIDSHSGHSMPTMRTDRCGWTVLGLAFMFLLGVLVVE